MDGFTTTNNGSSVVIVDDSLLNTPTQKVIDQETRSLIDRLQLERIPLAGIARAVQVSEPWLPNYVNQKYASVPRQVQVRRKKKGRLTISM
ncbi:hypothetical protein N39L_20230 [Limnospira platensis NIES-39]|nr:hypothetical protein N39L_20230 [Arthrospira platensis NIES-39]